MIQTETRVAILKRIHLFRELNDEELAYLAERFSESEFGPGEVIYEQGSKSESFFLIYKGSVRIVRKRENSEQQLATLVDNDYFGEMELLNGAPHNASVIAASRVILLVLSRENFEELFKRNPALRPSLDVTIRSRSLARQLQFKWLHEGEVVYFVARKHPILLYDAMGAPALVLLLAIALAVWSVFSGAVTPAAVGGIVLIGDIAWAVWRVIDWSNDYYVVTNERVVWLEKVIGLYDSRQEAPLSTVLSVGVETDVWGRALDYGNVIVRTFVGKIPFNHVPHPAQAARVIEEYWQRTKQSTSKEEKEAMRNAIRAKLGLPVEGKAAATTQATAVKVAPKLTRQALVLKAFGSDRLKIRYETGDTVVYRKHWFILLRQAGLPAFMIIAVLGLIVRRLFILAFDPTISLIHQGLEGRWALDASVLTFGFLLIPLFIWMVYQTIDWSNDVFQVTQDQIVDLDRTPFGTEQRRAAQLENILGTEYKRQGLIGNLFNFGTVYITVGGTQLAFDDVMDPATVQSDIDRRRMARKAQTQATEVAAERERMADWLAAYNENAEEFQRPTDTRPKTE